ncbi:MAG: hypothetical protein KAI79_16040 [Bacteroidales bacterium]|nr:hypothetical protein [Bacteroidales bacterium]
MKILEKKMNYYEAINYCKNKLWRLPKPNEITTSILHWVHSTIRIVPNGAVDAKIVQTNRGDINANSLCNVVLISTLPKRILSTAIIYTLKQCHPFTANQYYSKKDINSLPLIQNIMEEADLVVFK